MKQSETEIQALMQLVAEFDLAFPLVPEGELPESPDLYLAACLADPTKAQVVKELFERGKQLIQFADCPSDEDTEADVLEENLFALLMIKIIFQNQSFFENEDESILAFAKDRISHTNDEDSRLWNFDYVHDEVEFNR